MTSGILSTGRNIVLFVKLEKLVVFVIFVLLNLGAWSSAPFVGSAVVVATLSYGNSLGGSMGSSNVTGVSVGSGGKSASHGEQLPQVVPGPTVHFTSVPW
jgi:hypothetical protein